MIHAHRFASTLLPLLFCLAATMSPARGDTVSGVVRAPNGQPVPGATLTYEPVTLFNLYGLAHEERSSTTSGPDGRFSFTVLPGRLPCGPAVASSGAAAVARITAPGLGLTDTLLKAGENVVTLPTAFTATGKVLDQAGKPVPRVHLRYLDQTSPIFQGTWISGELTTIDTVSGGDGTWSLAGLPGDQPAQVEVDDPRLCRESQPTVAGQPMRICPQPFLSLKGRVVALDGTPIAGVRVFAGDPRFGAESLVQAQTGPDGGYTVTGLLPSTLFVLKFLDPNDHWFAPSLRVANPNTSPVIAAPDWRAAPGVTVTARLISSVDKSPLPGSQIFLEGCIMETPGADAEGKIAVTLPAYNNFLQITGPTNDYLVQNRITHINPGQNSLDLGDIELTRGTFRRRSSSRTVAAVARDGGGRKVLL